MASIRAVLIVALVGLLYLVLVLPQWWLVRSGSPQAVVIPRLFHRIVLWALGLKVTRRGQPSTARPTLFVSNHVSWIDIMVLGSELEASFVAKHEVDGWPFFGTLARLQRTVFVERKARRTADHRDLMVDRLAAGDSLILFPEGTSSDGLRILPFKSAFFSLAERRFDDRPLMLQPISLAYTELCNLPVGRRWSGLFAWIGDQDLMPHLWRFLRAGPAVATIEYHPPVTIDGFASRKALAAWVQTVVAQGVSDAHAGRITARPAPPPNRMVPPSPEPPDSDATVTVP